VNGILHASCECPVCGHEWACWWDSSAAGWPAHAPAAAPEYAEIIEYILMDGTSGGYSVCEAGKGTGGAVADAFDTPAEAAAWARENGFTVVCGPCGDAISGPPAQPVPVAAADLPDFSRMTPTGRPS